MDEKIRKGLAGFLYLHGSRLNGCNAVLALPDPKGFMFTTMTSGDPCGCKVPGCPAKLMAAISAICHPEAPRVGIFTLVHQHQLGGLELQTYGLAEVWALEVELDEDGDAKKWWQVDVAGTAITKELETFLQMNPHLREGWAKATEFNTQPQTLQHNG